MKSLYLNRIILILLLLNSLWGISNAQEITLKSAKPVFITGITYDSKTHEPLSNTNFKVNNKNVFTTNELGRFSFYGSPSDSIEFTYMGYQPTMLVIPDTLKSDEYVVGVFMYEQPIKLAEIIILPRMPETSMIITPVKTDQQTMDIAQGHANDAVVKGLTQYSRVYDADMNAKKAIRNNQMRTEYKGMLVSPENSVGVSTQSYRTYSIIYGSPITTPHKIAKEMISNNESAILLEHFEAINKIMLKPETATDTIVTR
ncbi:MAG TPA: hypothetical protein VFC67_05460 [Prolixibacteraceae bacterium]|nr:hypothetical protein [Prolixibacteraceae bacterium]